MHFPDVWLHSRLTAYNICVGDGIHWNEFAHRKISNILLRHICDAWNVILPAKFLMFASCNLTSSGNALQPRGSYTGYGNAISSSSDEETDFTEESRSREDSGSRGSPEEHFIHLSPAREENYGNSQDTVDLTVIVVSFCI